MKKVALLSFLNHHGGVLNEFLYLKNKWLFKRSLILLLLNYCGDVFLRVWQWRLL